MIQCLIIDDETAAIDILTQLIAKVPFLSLVATTHSTIDGIHIIAEKKIDLIFLDIKMPEMSGLDFVKAIQGKCRVIFTTAHTKYAFEGFELGVIDYLLKPIPLPRFIQAVQKAWDVIMPSNTSKDAYVEGDHIYVKTEQKGKLIKIEFTEIDYIESERNYAAIRMGREKVLVLIGLIDLENILPKLAFIRVHRSFIVPTGKIKGIEGNVVLLKGVEQGIPLGEKYKEEFLESIKHRLI